MLGEPPMMLALSTSEAVPGVDHGKHLSCLLLYLQSIPQQALLERRKNSLIWFLHPEVGWHLFPQHVFEWFQYDFN